MCEVASFKNFENSLTTVKVMTKNKVAPFYLGHGVLVLVLLTTSFDLFLFHVVFKTELLGNTIQGLNAYDECAGPIASALTNKFGCRIVSVAGTLIASFGFIISIWAPNIWFMYFSFGCVSGACTVRQIIYRVVSFISN